jgi:hypothetical protein
MTNDKSAAAARRFRDIGMHAKVVISLLALCGFFALLTIVFEVSTLTVLDRLGRGEVVAESELVAADLRHAQMGSVLIGAFAVATLASAAWIFLFLRNARALSDAATRYSPIWSAISIFVPIVNLWYPYAAVAEAARRSAGPESRGRRRLLFAWSIVAPLAFLARDGVRFLLWPEAQTFEGLIGETWIGIGAVAVQVLALYVTGSVIAELTAAQHKQARASAAVW